MEVVHAKEEGPDDYKVSTKFLWKKEKTIEI